MIRILLVFLLASSASSTVPHTSAPAVLPPPLCEPADAPDTAAVFVKKVVNDYAVIRFEADVNNTNASRILAILADAPTVSFKYLVVELRTPGGLVSEGQRIAEAIEHSKLPVYCVVDTWAASMGFYILQACAYRMMLKDAIVLAHEPYRKALFGMNRFALKQAEEELTRTAEQMIDFEVRRLLVSRAEFSARTAGPDKAWRMNAEEALRVGAVDEVVETLEQATSRPAPRPSTR